MTTTEFAPLQTVAEFDAAIERIGFPAILKTRRMGYDGKGQWTLRTNEDVEKVRGMLPSVPLILEKFVTFSSEVSMLGVRSKTGETAFYPVVENHHRDRDIAIVDCTRAKFDERNAGGGGRGFEESLWKHSDTLECCVSSSSRWMGDYWQMKWLRESTIPAIGRSKVR